jgi:hypothetical protein
VDIIVQGFNDGLSFNGEFQNYEKPVDLRSFKEILKRVPVTSNFHLVVVSQLQPRYKIDLKDTDFQHLAGANVMKVVVVNRSVRSLSVAPVFAKTVIPWNVCRALILFVEEAVINGDQVSSSSSNTSAKKKQRRYRCRARQAAALDR